MQTKGTPNDDCLDEIIRKLCWGDIYVWEFSMSKQMQQEGAEPFFFSTLLLRVQPNNISLGLLVDSCFPIKNYVSNSQCSITPEINWSQNTCQSPLSLTQSNVVDSEIFKKSS